MDLYALFSASPASLAADTALSSSLAPPAHPFHLKTITTLSLPAEPQSPSPACSLHLLFQLPPSIFIDPYELEELEDHYGRLRYRVWGETDLEKPVSAVDSRGSVLLVDVGADILGNAHKKGGGGELQVEVPMHVRYLSPSPWTSTSKNVSGRPGQVVSEGMYEPVEWSWPLGFYACPRRADQVPEKEVQYNPLASIPAPFVSPFDATHTDITLIPPHPTANSTTYRALVPVGNIEHLSLVQYGTTLVVLLSFLYVGVACWRAASSLKAQRDKAE
ncbi:hypothetical protein BOTBODRAFT_177121 [Botryobasidium botryosum FD-172 SS1]|uniref:Protein PBN1 n=1 Tax=Botryobasidium botryosum (strain FD-172 SS1) TaxID=930990 RepID=A0A067M7J2_BOTB1|nr:hypothetical protein BOTBODRAFT_177121 [Botryobasidium botryosum FD-172 SS1]